jgi:hypothetical protein
MSNTIWIAVGACLLAVSTTAVASYDCVEVELFKVDRSEIKDKKDKRAATIPREALATLQQAIVLEIPLSVPGAKGMYANEESCPNPDTAVVMGGTVSDYKKGSKAMRYWVGMGAGAQKFAVEAWVRPKNSDQAIATDEIIDRKVGGLLGGEDEKGVDDFSEKVARFIGAAMGRPRK